MNGGIYTITSPSGLQYVGSAASFSKRWYRHRKGLKEGTHYNKRLLAASRKYGPDGFVFKILLICEPKDQVFYEQRAIDVLKPKYNICAVAGSCVGVKQSAEAIAKRVAKMRGRQVSQETREKIAAAHRGRKMPESFRLAMIGRKHTAETKAKVSASKRDRCTPELRQRLRVANLGKKRPPRSVEWCQKISQSKCGRTPTLETRAKMSASAKARTPMNVEVRAKISSAVKALWVDRPRPTHWKCGHEAITENRLKYGGCKVCRRTYSRERARAKAAVRAASRLEAA